MTSRFDLLSPILFAALLAGCRTGPSPARLADRAAEPVAAESVVPLPGDRTTYAQDTIAGEARQASYSSQPEILPQGALWPVSP